jgi:hypothetical protein
VSKKLHYGPHEIKIREDEDIAALRKRITHTSDGWVEIRDKLGNTHHLLISPGIPITVVDVRPRAAVVSAPQRIR